MKFPQKWMNHWFLREMAGLTGFRNAYDLHGDEPFIPYFQYRVGDYQSDHYLYFKAPPRKWDYTWEIFQKMYEYEGYDLIRYIEFHYKAYEDKEDFLRWFRYETSRQLRRLRKYRFVFWMRLTKIKTRLQTTLEWVEEEEKRRKERPAEVIASQPENDSGAEEEAGFLERIEVGMVGLLRAHSGKIVLYNEYHAMRLIQLLILLKDTQTGGKKRIQLFKSFSDTDMAAVLRQFELFGDKKTNTLQVKIGEAKAELNLDDPAVQKLSKALMEFFFS
jgi:hypothetical protein